MIIYRTGLLGASSCFRHTHVHTRADDYEEIGGGEEKETPFWTLIVLTKYFDYNKMDWTERTDKDN